MGKTSSTRSVVLAKLGGTAALHDARTSIERGFNHIGTKTTDEASGQRGWLFNNAGLVEVMDFLKSRDEAAIERAGDWLRKAMREVQKMPFRHCITTYARMPFSGSKCGDG